LLVDRLHPSSPLAPCRDARDTRRHLTALSGPQDEGPSRIGRLWALGGLARRSLSVLSLALLAPGCLVTSEPVSYEPIQTPPIIVASGLSPDPRDILLFGGATGVKGELRITASVLSEDVGESVKVALYADYGARIENSKFPYRYISLNFLDLPASTLADGPRPLEDVTWVIGNPPLDPGCHRLTLMVTHEFAKPSLCPANLNDSSQVTWHLRQCDVGDCPPVLEDCPPVETSCPLDPTKTETLDAGTTGG